MRPAVRSILVLPIAFGLTACAASGPPRAMGPAQLPAATTPEAGMPGRPDAASQELQRHARASAPRPPALPSPVAIALDAASLARAPQRVVAARVDGADLRCRGVALFDLLRNAGAVPPEPLQGPQLARYVLADGSDGERVLFSLAELDPPAGNREVAVVGHCGDGATDAAQQPPRLLTPDGRRDVRRLRAVTVVVAP